KPSARPSGRPRRNPTPPLFPPRFRLPAKLAFGRNPAERQNRAHHPLDPRHWSWGSRALAAEGCNIVMNGLCAPEMIEANRRRLEKRHGVRALFHGADVAQPADIASLVETAL